MTGINTAMYGYLNTSGFSSLITISIATNITEYVTISDKSSAMLLNGRSITA